MKDIDKDILVRYFSGATSSDENDSIKSWVSESNDNKKLLEQCYFIWKTAGCIHTMETVDTQKALFEFKGRAKQKKMKNLRKIYLLWAQRVAAILFIPTLLFSYYLYEITSNEITQYMEVRTNPGMISSVILPDSSIVWLNSGGYLKYPVRFPDDKREIELQGEGYFEVRKKENASFTVKIDDNYTVEALGTKFNITAYPGEDKIETTLVDGSVRLKVTTKEKKTIQHFLKPNQKGTFTDDKLTVSWVDPIYEMGWKDGKMYFKNHPMEDVIKRLSRHYNVVFSVKNPEILESLITAKFESDQLPQVMEYLRLASGIKYKIHKTNIDDNRLGEITVELTK